MAQRLLLGFDNLDEYSKEIMKKHAKKASLSHMQLIRALKIPVMFNFESDDSSEQGSDKHNGTSIVQDDNVIITPRYQQHHLANFRSLTSVTSLHQPKSDISSKRLIRPFSASGPADHKESVQEEREANKQAKRRCKSAVIRRRTWKSEVECIPELAMLCQEKCKLPILSTLDLSGFLYQSSLIANTPGAAAESSTTSEESAAILATHIDTGRIGGHPLTNKETDGKLTTAKPEEETTIEQDDSHAMEGSYHARKPEIPVKSVSLKQRNIVSLSIEDEIKKPSNKILWVRQQAASVHAPKVSETVPVIFENNHKREPHGVPRKALVANTRSLIRPNGAWIPGDLNLFLKDKPGHVRGLSKQKHDSIARGLSTHWNKKTGRILSGDVKVNVHFLAANGTTWSTDGRRSKNLSARLTNGISSLETQPAIKPVSIQERRQGTSEVGPVINGMNPRKVESEKPSFYVRRSSPSKSTSQNRSRVSERSQCQRPISVGEERKWGYISIAKTLTPPGCPPSPTPRLELTPLSSPEITYSPDTPVSSRVNSTMSFTTKPVIFENRRGRLASLSAEIAHLQPGRGEEKTTEMQQLDKSKTKSKPCKSEELVNVYDTPRPITMPLVSERSGSKSPLNVTIDKAASAPAVTSMQPEVFPVINIPTAQTETTE